MVSEVRADDYDQKHRAACDDPQAHDRESENNQSRREQESERNEEKGDRAEAQPLEESIGPWKKPVGLHVVAKKLARGKSTDAKCNPRDIKFDHRIAGPKIFRAQTIESQPK